MAASEAVTLERATSEMDSLLRNLLELYVHDMREVFPVELGSDGRFGYERLPLYWSEPALRHAFLIKHGSRVAGFVLATLGSPASDNPSDFDVAEFFVLRRYRRAGVGRQAAFALWDGMPGHWVVRVSEAHRAGVQFWRETIHAYTSGALTETSWPGRPGDWRVFKFESGGV